MTLPNNGQWRSGSKDWREVSRASPCPICQKPDWCGVSKDGQLVACRREARGAIKIKTDRNGAEVYLHRVGTHHVLDPGHAGNGHTGPRRSQAENPSQIIPRADAQGLDRAYRALLDTLILSDVHCEGLKRRGLTDDAIADRGYRSLPKAGRAAVARILYEHLGTDCANIPGLVPAGATLTIVSPEGMLIPCRDDAGRIVALKVRRDTAAKDNKYMYLSSRRHGGPGPGAPVHVPLGIAAPALTVRITEGELKADVATLRSGLPTISIPGVANWRAGIPVLQAIGAKTVRLAFDADLETNHNVAKALVNCAEALVGDEFNLELERWDPAIAKGIDDLLTAGHSPELLVGDAALAAIKGIAHAAGVTRPLASSSELGIRLQSVLDSGGPAKLFADRQLLDELAVVAARDPAEWGALREQMRRADVKLRDFDRALRPMIRKAHIDRPATMPIEETEVYFISEAGCICR